MRETSETLNNQAIELASKGEYKEAIACFIRAISMERQNYLLWFNLGITYRDAGNLEDAKNAIHKAHLMNPYDEEVIESLAIICFNMGRFEEAFRYCTAGLGLNDANYHLWNTLGVLYFNQSDYGSASEAFEQALSINPYYYDALYNLQDTYSELGNESGAKACALRMKELKR